MQCEEKGFQFETEGEPNWLALLLFTNYIVSVLLTIIKLRYKIVLDIHKVCMNDH